MRVTSIAMDYRRKFNKDVIIDFICFRKHGHNELDDPFFTNPKMYKAVKGRESIPNLYAESIVVWTFLFFPNLSYDSFIRKKINVCSSFQNTSIKIEIFQIRKHAIFHISNVFY